MVAASLLTTLLLALVVAARPTARSLARTPLKKNVQTGNPVRYDQRRIEHLKAKGGDLNARQAINSPADNRAVVYTASIGVGSPATQYNVIIDTGSSNSFIGAGIPYTPTSTSSQTPDSVSVSYGTGHFTGKEYIDQVTIADGLVIPQQSIGVVEESTGFDGFDGLIGLGPVDLTVGTLSPDTSSSIPTVTDNLFSSGSIAEHLVSISFEPITDSTGQQLNGELSWGGTDSDKYIGEITYTPITSTSPASHHWGIDASLAYGTTSILSSTAGIVDTGTSLLQIASDAFTRYKEVTGAVSDQTTGLLTVTSTQYANMQSLFLTVSGVSFELTPNAQIWPRSLNEKIGGVAGSIYLIVTDIGSNSGAGLDFILGMTFLERFYSVYDTGNQRVGLATTSFTTATSN